MSSTINVAFTSRINPADSSSPPLTRAQIWAGLLRKIKAGQDFVGGAILSTDVISESTDPDTGNPVTVREVVFRDGNRRVREVCTAYEPTKVEFAMQDGSKVTNVVSEGSEGELYMTYVFAWKMPGLTEEQRKETSERQKGMSKMAVESTIEAMREMVKDGRITA